MSALLFAFTQEASPSLHSRDWDGLVLVSARVRRFAAPAVSRVRLLFYQAVGNATTPPTVQFIPLWRRDGTLDPHSFMSPNRRYPNAPLA